MKEILQLGDPRLRVKAESILPEELENLFAPNSIVAQMVEVLIKTKGIGLAAPQLGINKAVILVKEPNDNISVLINPEIVKRSSQTTLKGEACLSCPGMLVPVLRSKSIKVRSMDRTGRIATEGVRGTSAIIIQHEVDHLNGTLISDLSERDPFPLTY
ncbi:MAG TPA: peptide deformylase [Bacteroidales bacterium]|nr:peptide deformylase [Bacteroidales bacterium]